MTRSRRVNRVVRTEVSAQETPKVRKARAAFSEESEEVRARRALDIAARAYCASLLTGGPLRSLGDTLAAAAVVYTMARPKARRTRARKVSRTVKP